MNGYATLTYDETTGERTLTKVEGKPSLGDMQDVVGGYIETLTRIPSPFRKNITIDVYVNEEGLLLNLPAPFAIRDVYGARLFAGNAVIVGANNRTGNTVQLTDAELVYLELNYDGHCLTLL